MPVPVHEIVSALERRYDPAWAESWDAVGLVCGDPRAEVERVLFAVDPLPEVVEEAVSRGAGLIVAHHPLLLRPVHGVAATSPKGAVVHRLIRAGIALFTAHTNADVADPGVSDALARAVGLVGPLRPLVPDPADPSGRRGHGRVGAPARTVPLREFVSAAAAALPATAGGLRVSGDPERPVRTVAVCGGAGDGFLDAARAARVDVYLTADLRHHPASEARMHPGPALVDVAHWASEWPWLRRAAGELEDALRGRGATVETRVSTLVTDPWTDAVGTATRDARPDVRGAAIQS